MDDFRVGSVSPDGSYSDRAPSAPRDRKKDKNKALLPQPEDDVVLYSERSDSDDVVEDYYSPSLPPDSGDRD